jgi:hypothetical protein
MARKHKANVNPLPSHYERETLETPEPFKFRRRNVTDGRGNNWQAAKLIGWDHHVTPEPCAIVIAEEGGYRTLSPELWEWK